VLDSGVRKYPIRRGLGRDNARTRRPPTQSRELQALLTRSTTSLSSVTSRGAGNAKLLTQVVRFLVFSGIAAVSNLGSGYFLYGVLGFKTGWRYTATLAAAFLVGVFVSFALNRRYTFDPSGRTLHQEVRAFLLISLGGLLLTTGLASLLRNGVIPGLIHLAVHEFGDINIELLSHAIAVAFVTFYSFIAHRTISFGKGFRHLLRRRSHEVRT